MADYQPLNIAPGGDTIRTGFQKVSDNDEKQLINWLDTTPPAAPLNGQHWGDAGDPADYRFFCRENGTDKALLWFHRLVENLDGAGHEFVGLIPQRVATGSIVTPGVSTEGTVQYDNVRKKLVYVTDSAVYEIASLLQTGAFTRLPTRLSVAARTNPGVVSAATEYGGYLLSAGSNEVTALGLVEIPDGYAGVASASQKVILEVDVLLAQAETVSDEIQFTGTVYVDSNQLAISGNSAAVPVGTTSIGTGSAIHSRHRVTITFAPGDFTANPQPGDILRASLALDTGQTVASAIIIGAAFRVSVDSATVST